jgi:hypothetical protein
MCSWLRQKFRNFSAQDVSPGSRVNSSFAIFQDATGRAFERVVALGIAIGSGYLFETDFKKEVYSDLTGERGTLMGAIQGIFAAQYEVLRKNGHTPSEAFKRNSRRADPKPDAAGCRKRYGLDVCKLFYYSTAWCA